jgi:predicted alpha/beta-hydrolase family hydrolase
MHTTRRTRGSVVATSRGDARVWVDRPDGAPVALVVLGHGAGGGVEAPDLVAVRDAALAAGLAVARVEQPYRVAGRRTPAPTAALDEAWIAAVTWLRAGRGGAARGGAARDRAGFADLPLVVGGRSSGARVACRTASALGAAAVVALAFPLHPPGRPDKTRLPELELPAVPVLVVQGDRDAFGMPPPARGRAVHVVPGADHSLRTARAAYSAAVVDWLGRTLPGRRLVGRTVVGRALPGTAARR